MTKESIKTPATLGNRFTPKLIFAYKFKEAVKLERNFYSDYFKEYLLLVEM